MKFNMKLIICIFALLVAAQAVPVKKDLGVAIKYVYEKFLHAFPCGIAGSGPLDPYYIEEKYTKEPFVFKEDDFEVSFHVKSFELRGLKSFKIASSEYNHETKEFKMFVIPPHLHLKSNYSWSLNLKYEDSYKMFNVEDGSIDAHFKFPQEKYGISWIFAQDEVTGNLTVTNMKFHEPVFDWVKEFDFLGEHYEVFAKEVKPMIEEMDADLDKIIAEHITEYVNKIFVNYKTVDNVVDELYKAAGDEHTGPFGDKVCVH